MVRSSCCSSMPCSWRSPRRCSPAASQRSRAERRIVEPARRRRPVALVGRAAHSSRRMTGKRSSSTAVTNPSSCHSHGCPPLVSFGAARQVGVRLDGAEAALRQVVEHRLEQLVGISLAARRGRRGDAGDDRRQRRIGQLRVQLAQSRRARIRRQWPELAVRDRLVVGHEHLGVRAENAAAAVEQRQLARHALAQWSLAHRRAARTGCRAVPRRGRRPRARAVLWHARRGRTGCRPPGGRAAQTGCRPRSARRACGCAARASSQAGRFAFDAALGILPVVTGSVVEARVGARRNESERLGVQHVDDPRCRHRSARGSAGDAQPGGRSPRRSSAAAMSGCRSRSRVEVLDALADEGVCRGHAATRPQAIGQPEVERLCRSEKLEGDYPLDVVEDRLCLARGDGAHRDVILLVRARREAVDRRWMASTLFSETSAAATYWKSIMPLFRPACVDQEGRQAGGMRVDQLRDAPLADRAKLGDCHLGEVHRQRNRLAVEVAARDHPPAAGRDGASGRRPHPQGRRADCRWPS